MPHALLITILLLSLMTFSGCGQPADAPPSASLEATPLPNQQPIAAGEALFTQHCSGCHVLQDPSTKALYQRSSALASAESLITLVRNPAPRPMPAFDDATLPDADVATLHAWIVEHVKS